MTYCFRLKFRMVTGLNVSAAPAELVLPFLPSVAKIASNAPRAPGVDQWITIKSCGYATREQAQANAVRLKDTILIIGASGLGTDFGVNRTRSSVSDDIKENIRTKFGTIIRDEVHGIDIFEDGDVRHFEVSAVLSVHTELADFSKRLREAGVLTELSSIARTGAELINDSLFPMPDEARFLLRISAIEAMCKQAQRSKAILDLIDQLITAMPSLTSDSHAAETLGNMLREARRQSVRQACLGKIRERLGDASAKEFDRLYGLRSDYVHEGKGRGFLSMPADEALSMAKRLLFSEIGYKQP